MAPLFAGVGLISSGTAAGISAIGNGGFIVSGIPGIIKSIKDYRQLSSMQEGVSSGALRQCKLKERQESLRKVYQSICSGFATKVAYASLNIAQTLSNSSLLSLGSILSLLFSGISQQASTCNKSDIKLEPNDNLLNIPSGKELSFFTSQIFALFCGAEVQDKLLSLTGRTMDSESEKSFCAELIDSYLEILSKKEQCASNLNEMGINELKEKSYQELDKIFGYGKPDLSSINDRLLIMLLSCIHTEVQNDKAYCRNAKGLYSAQHLQKNMIEPIIKVFAYYEIHNCNHSGERAALLAHTSCEREQDEEEDHSATYMGNQSVQYRHQITEAVYV